jgi:hypothetical protein
MGRVIDRSEPNFSPFRKDESPAAGRAHPAAGGGRNHATALQPDGYFAVENENTVVVSYA